MPVRHSTPTYWVMTSWPLVIAGPLPWMRVLTTSLDGGLVLGILMVGALPAVAVTVGRPFAAVGHLLAGRGRGRGEGLDHVDDEHQGVLRRHATCEFPVLP